MKYFNTVFSPAVKNFSRQPSSKAGTDKAIETGIILSTMGTRSLIKQQLPLCFTRQQFKFLERFSELIKDLQKIRDANYSYNLA